MYESLPALEDACEGLVRSNNNNSGRQNSFYHSNDDAMSHTATVTTSESFDVPIGGTNQYPAWLDAPVPSQVDDAVDSSTRDGSDGGSETDASTESEVYNYMRYTESRAGKLAMRPLRDGANDDRFHSLNFREMVR